jgi:hypothetical protein
MLSDDAAAPVDRPNLSKDHHAGSAREEWLPLRADSFYAEAEIELRLNTDVNSLSARPCPQTRNGQPIAPGIGRS